MRHIGFLLLLLAGLFPARAEGDYRDYSLRRAFPNLKLNRPLWIGGTDDATERLFAVEQDGRILILPTDRAQSLTNVFLDLSPRRLHVENEEGLLGLAFHPKFKSTGRLYVYYSQQNPRRGVLSEFQVLTNNPEAANRSSERVLLQVPQPYANHNGGALAFGPDGYLYLSLGDGGLANDPHDFGQNLHTLLGKILRLDVDAPSATAPYGIPADNPFADRGGGVRPEIWAYGLRNVWRMAFDPATGFLWAGDVGQNKWEEINLIRRGGNYGWSLREGFHPFRENPDPKRDAACLDPVLEYPHSPAIGSKLPHAPGLSITGGIVYRGQKLQELIGSYIYADYQMGTVWALQMQAEQIVRRGLLVTPNPARPVSSFGEDAHHELLLTAFDGYIYELSARQQ